MEKFELYSDIMQEILFVLDESEKVQFVSDNLVKVLGYEVADWIGKKITEFIYEPKETYFYQNKFTQIDCFSEHMNMKHLNTSCLNMSVRWKIKDLDDKKIIVGSMIEDMNQNTSSIYDKTLMQFLDNKKDILYKYEVYPKRGFIYLGKAVELVLGHDREAHLNNPDLVLEFAYPDDRNILIDKLSGKLGFDKPIVMRWKHKSGRVVWMEDHCSPEYDKNGRITAIEGICRDITEQKNTQERLKYDIYHDSLTSCKNRRFYDEKIKEFDVIKGVSIGIIMVDIDNLKRNNDLYGHDTGDVLIQSVAKLLIGITKHIGVVCRIGGDEFAILIKNQEEKEILTICDTIDVEIKQEKLEKSLVDFSYGSIYNKESYHRMKELIAEADRRMYQNKSQKKLQKKSLYSTKLSY